MNDGIEGELEDLGLVDRTQREKYVAESSIEPTEHPLLGPIFSTKTQGELEHETEVRSNIVEHPLLGPLFQKEAEFEYEIVGKDERNLVRRTKEIPFRWICYLKLGFGELVGRGTGTLIGGRYVLTAGHCLFDHEHSLGAVTEVRVVPAKNELIEPFGSRKMLRVDVHPNWKNNADNEYDYGLITLDKSFGSSLGSWKRTSSLETERLRNIPVNIAGYPGDKCGTKPSVGSLSLNELKKCNPKRRASTMWKDFKNIQEPTDRLLLYDLDTYGGMSGSPVWIRWKEYRSIIGIHTGGWNKNKNRGVRITNDVIGNIQNWMK